MLFRELLLGRIADCLLLRDEYKNEFRRVKENAEEKGEKNFDFRLNFSRQLALSRNDRELVHSRDDRELTRTRERCILSSHELKCLFDLLDLCINSFI